MLFVYLSSKCLLYHAVLLRTGFSQPDHRHFELNREQFDLTLLNEVSKSLQNAVLGELLGTEDKSLGGEVTDGPVENFQGEQFLDQGIVLEKGGLESAGHRVLVDESTLTTEVFVNHSQDGQDVFPASTVFEQFIVDAENRKEELSSEREVEFRIFSNQFGNEGQHVEHVKLCVLVLALILYE